MLTTVIHSVWTENVSYTDSAFSETAKFRNMSTFSENGFTSIYRGYSFSLAFLQNRQWGKKKPLESSNY